MHTVGFPRTCLGCTNIVFFLISSIGLIICVWCVISTEFFKEVNYTVTKSSLVSSIADFVNLKLWLTPLTSILIPVAVLTLMTSCCGILSAGCKVQCAIKSYMFLVTVLSLISAWLFFITVLYNIYTNNSRTFAYMKTMLHDDYGKEGDVVTYMINSIMTGYECCGIANAKDFIDSNWRLKNKDKLYPLECCRLRDETSRIPVNANCTRTYDLKGTYLNIGCFSALRKAISSNKGKLTFYLIALMWLYGVVIAFAYCIMKGEPLLGKVTKRLALLQNAAKGGEILPQDGSKPAPSHSSLQNMLFAEEPPKWVTRVVSAVNPYQTYKLQPQIYARGDPVQYPRTMRGHV